MENYKKLIEKHHKSNSQIVNINNIRTDDKSKISNAFCSYFADIGKQCAASIEHLIVNCLDPLATRVKGSAGEDGVMSCGKHPVLACCMPSHVFWHAACHHMCFGMLHAITCVLACCMPSHVFWHAACHHMYFKV